MNLSSPSALVALLCLFFATLVTPLSAQTATAKVKKIPFHGKLAAVDTGAQTITIAGKKANRVFHLTATTRITDGAGNPSSLAAATVGEDVGGSYAKDTMTLFSVRFGAKVGSKSEAAQEPAPAAAAAAPAPTPSPMPAAAPTAAAAAPTPETAPAAVAPEKKKRFSGKVVSVDAAGGTFVVRGLTLTTTAATKMTGATSLSDLAAGDKVSGSYLPTGDGKSGTATSLKKVQ